MKRIIAVLLTLAMLACALLIVSAEEAEPTYDIPAILEANGHEHIRLTKPTTPTLDGVISEGEYTAVRVIEDVHTSPTVVVNPYQAHEARSFTEYFAYDADYIYYAFTGTIKTNAEQYFQFKPFRPVTAAEMSSMQEVCNKFHGDWYRIAAGGTIGAGVSQGDSSYSSTPFTEKMQADAAINYVADLSPENVIELKVSRQFMATTWKTDSNVYSIFVRPHNNWCMLGNPLSTEDLADLGNPAVTHGQYAPRYIILENDETITDVKASVRISEEQNGLRFKTKVNNAFIEDLKAVEGNVVSVGTLIAPTDTLGGAKLTHEFAGKKLDVQATLDAPFAEGDLYNTYAGSITSLSDYNLDRDFTAVGYIKVTNGESVEYYYSEVGASRSAAYVAEKALEDAESYTATQLELIQALIPAKVEA